MGIGVCVRPIKGTGTLLEGRTLAGKVALHKVQVLPWGFEHKAVVVAVIVAALYGVELMDVGPGGWGGRLGWSYDANYPPPPPKGASDQ